MIDGTEAESNNVCKSAIYSDRDHKPIISPPLWDHIPAGLIGQNRWVLWSLRWNNTSNKWTKIPHTIHGRNASSADHTTWATFPAVRQAFTQHSGKGVDGVGFVLGDGVVGIDLDDCRDSGTGVIAPWAAEIIERAGTYCEVSPSGTGLKLFGRGSWSAEWHRKKVPDGEIEVYDCDRYFCVTGNIVGSSRDLTDITSTLEWVDSTYSTPVTGSTTHATGHTHRPSDSDTTLIELAKRSNDGGKFSKLWDGDSSGYKSQSEAVQALLCKLAFWTSKNPARMESLFRASGLWNEKWSREKILQSTIKKAIEITHDVYKPKADKASSPRPSATTTTKPPRQIPEYRPFPVNSLPAIMHEYVTGVAQSVGVDPAFAALPALTVAGAAIGTSTVITPKRGWSEPPILWTICVGDSGTGKSPCLRPTQGVAISIDSELRRKFLAERDEYQTALETWKTQDEPDPETKPRPPWRERYLVSDITIEGLVELFQGPCRGLALIRDEIDGWFRSFKRYAKPGASDASAWLSLYDGAPIRYHRRTGDPKCVECDQSFVGITGGIQPGVLSQTLSDGSLVESGMAARMLLTYPPKYCPAWSDSTLSQEVEIAFETLLRKLRDIPHDSKGGPNKIGLDAVAFDRFKALNDEFAKTAETHDGDALAAVLPKATRQALRLALVWHCVNEFAHGRDPLRSAVSGEAMAAAETLIRWFVGEAERVDTMVGEEPEDRAARILADWVRRRGGTVTVRDLQRNHKRRYPTAEAAELALESLVSAGLANVTENMAGNSKKVRTYTLRVVVPDDTGDDTAPEAPEETPVIPGKSEAVSSVSPSSPVPRGKKRTPQRGDLFEGETDISALRK